MAYTFTLPKTIADNPEHRVGGRMETSQVSVGATSTEIIGFRNSRISVLVQNQHASAAVYIGFISDDSGNRETAISTSNTIKLEAGQSLEINTISKINGITASGTVTVGVMEVFA